MAKSLFGGHFRVVLLAGIFAACASAGWGAGEWEWTEGQGWIQGAGVSRPTAKEQLAYAYELEQRGEFMDAARQYFLLIQNFPEASESGVGLQRLAKCLFEMENYYTSYQAIEQVIKSYPNTGRMSDLIEIELRIAKKMLLSQASASVFESDTNARDVNARRAIQIVDSVIDHDPYGPAAPEAYLVKGEAHLYIGEIPPARAAFETIIDEFSRSDFVERARLGVLRCDSLLGQARPQEVYEQIQVVREMEAERPRDSGDWDEFDDVEESINQLAEVEAAKMMEQAAVYRRMGTRNGVQAAEFLYKEVARRYPGTPQAEDAREKLGGIEMPREQSRMAQAVRNIKLNPFTWNRDPEPPWIVPQLKPEDTVMVDSGMGPIAGVPETDFMVDPNAPSVRPAALDGGAVSADLALGGGGGPAGFSPIDAAPRESASSQSTFMPAPSGAYGGQGYAPTAPGSLDLEPARAFSTPNPLPTVDESDLIMTGGSGMGGYSAPAAPAPVVSQPSYPASGYSAPTSDLTLGPIPDAALSDLVGPVRRPDAGYAMPAAPSGDFYSQPTYAQPPAYPEPSYAGSPYPDPGYQGPTYSSAPSYPDPTYAAPPPPVYPEPSLSSGQTYSQGAVYGNEAPGMGGGWTLGDDFR